MQRDAVVFVAVTPAEELHELDQQLAALRDPIGFEQSLLGRGVEGCDLAAGKLCSPGKECCSGLCIDTKKDPLNCGSCGFACSTANATPTCTASVCTWTCANGYAHCTNTNSGCETNTRSDALHCGACDVDCGANATCLAQVQCQADAVANDCPVL